MSCRRRGVLARSPQKEQECVEQPSTSALPSEAAVRPGRGNKRRRITLAHAAAGAGLGVVACGGGQEVVGAPKAAPAVAAVETRAPEPEPDPFDEEVARALELVGRVRELPPRRAVRGEILGREAMVARVRRSIREEVPAEVIAAQEEMLFALGTVPVDFDYERSLLQLVEDQLAGFYEPEDETMYLGGDLGPTARWATLAHELVHALQDQHYDLGERVEYREDGTDEQSAVHALAEGDATSAMFDFLNGQPATEMSQFALGMMFRGSAAVSSGGEVPELLKRSLVSPYVDGLGLVHWARRRGGWQAVDAIWRRPPTSTEQVLHPEKWLSNEAPVGVGCPPAPGKGWKEDYRDVLGEQSLRLVFEEWMPRFRAEEAASDWGGDRVAVYSRGRTRALAWRIVFDDEGAAIRATTAFARGVLGAGERAEASRLFAVTQERAEAALERGPVCVERPGAGPFAVTRNERGVGVVGGPYEREGDGESARSAGSCAGIGAWLGEVARVE